MHLFGSVTLIAAVGLANAQLSSLPSCSLSCFSSALQSDGCSELTDFACHCQKPSLMSSIEPCVKDGCDSSDQTAVSSVVVSLCSSVGHPLSVPPVEDWSTASETATTVTATSSSSGSSASKNPSKTASSQSQSASQTGNVASNIGSGGLPVIGGAILVSAMAWVL
ncbi:hypothetical protein N7456_013339 [Penicillium angulare]|uniref:CFEM domain-containing protein n=1 Tax=Penicillium angulare TaxID=116970 RepID=A0A9W9EG28_9EURO|nr:hypothetical protein N7456_013339 [Penicillium angulare]